MQHPNENDLSLYAGNDLGRMARLRVDWHLRTCGKCQQEVTDFSSLRADILRNVPEPNVNWENVATPWTACATLPAGPAAPSGLTAYDSVTQPL